MALVYIILVFILIVAIVDTATSMGILAAFWVAVLGCICIWIIYKLIGV